MQVLTTFAHTVQKLVVTVGEKADILQVEIKLNAWLQELAEASAALSNALDAEVEFGEKALSIYGSDAAAAVARWQERRAEVNRKQEAYYQAVTTFREQLPRLPRSLRTHAAEQGLRAMKVRAA